MEKINTVVIGAGAIGLAIAYELSKQYPDLVVVEKEPSFGRHTSSRNSEVIHAGHYYNPGSLKAKLCVEGNSLLYQYLKEQGLRYRNSGKIIVATDDTELDVLSGYLRNGVKNGCIGFKLLESTEVQELEPTAKCKAGLWIPSTGIFDTHEYMLSLANSIEDNGAFIVYGEDVTNIMYENGCYQIEFVSGESYQCKNLVNSAGLWADQIAAMVGLDTEALNIKQHLCKGQYYKTTKLKGIEHLVYPVADPKGVFLGIHLTINLAGEVRFGPNAFYIDEIDYRFEDRFFDEFYQSINRYIEMSKEDLMPDDVGIRPKLQGPNEGFRDFYIKEESLHGFPGLINLIGMESPGLTASLAIAKYVADLMK